MDLSVVFHIAAGSVGIVSGFLALFAVKGAPLHRRVGTAFVVSMLAMTASGALLAVIRNAEPDLNVPAAVMTAYLVVTALATLRPLEPRARWLLVTATVVAIGTGLFVLRLGFEAVALGGTRHGMPAFPFFLFATIGLAGAAGDLRLLRAGGIAGAKRVNRHLWRMGVALFVAAMSFFIGQMDEFPKAWRIVPLLIVPPFTALLAVAYWVWRVRLRRKLAGFRLARPEEAAT